MGPGSGHQERARAVERRGRRFRRFFAVRKDVRKVGGAFATLDRQIFFLQWQQACSALQVLAALRRDTPGRRAAAPAGRRIAEACALLGYGVPPPLQVPGTRMCVVFSLSD